MGEDCHHLGGQVASPWLQQKKIEEARLQFFRSRALQRVASFPMRSTSRTNRLFQVRKVESHECLKFAYYEDSLQEAKNLLRVVSECVVSCRLFYKNLKFSLFSTSIVAHVLQDDKQGHLTDTVKNLFHTFDHNKDGKIQQEELRGLIVGIGLEEAG